MPLGDSSRHEASDLPNLWNSPRLLLPILRRQEGRTRQRPDEGPDRHLRGRTRGCQGQVGPGA